MISVFQRPRQYHVNDLLLAILIVNLQIHLLYRYEELSKRFETLLRAYDDRCNLLNTRDATLSRLRQRARLTHARLSHAHQALLSVGEKFLALRERRIAQVGTLVQ